jgi:hypothetical protein
MSDKENHWISTISTVVIAVAASASAFSHYRERQLPTEPIKTEQTPSPTAPPITTPTVAPSKAIILSRENGLQEVCVNSPDPINSIQFHAWYNNGQGASTPMTPTSDTDCRYRVTLENSEGGTFLVNNDWAKIGDYTMMAGPGCSEVVRIEQGVIAASTAPGSSLLGRQDNLNGRSEQWGWACK